MFNRAKIDVVMLPYALKSALAICKQHGVKSLEVESFKAIDLQAETLDLNGVSQVRVSMLLENSESGLVEALHRDFDSLGSGMFIGITVYPLLRLLPASKNSDQRASAA